MKTYTILKGINSTKFFCLDKDQMQVKQLEYGHFLNKTKKCERMAKSKTKRDCMGAKWFNAMLGKGGPSASDILLSTDCAKEYFDKLIELQVRQAESFARVLRDHNKWDKPFALGYNDTKF